MIKQTQTKLFDFSDAGLDFSAGSKALFPDRFKKMFTDGYNPQAASSVSIAGSAITLTYALAHGYVQSRVLQVTAAGGYNKEVYIDSVTTTTVTFTDATATGLSGVINTKVAPLGYELVYEVGNVHIYKMKNLDESDLFLRILWQATSGALGNWAHPCVGRTANLTTGVITDTNSLANNKEITTPNSATTILKWAFAGSNATHNTQNYTAGFSTFGKACVVGSKYHLAILTNTYAASGGYGQVNSVIPFASLDYEALNLPILTGMVAVSGFATSVNFRMFVGQYELSYQAMFSNYDYRYAGSQSRASFLPSPIDGFNTTAVKPIIGTELATFQFIGMSAGGGYICCYGQSNTPSKAHDASPSITSEIDFTNRVVVHYVSDSFGSANNTLWLAFPLEEIKHGA